MKLFKTDPVAALDAEQAALLQVESVAIRLSNDRVTLIESADGDIAAVLKLDTEIAKQHQAAAVHRDRIAALQRQCREQERQRREQENAAGIADHCKRRAKILEGAKEMEAGQKLIASGFSKMAKAYEEADAHYPSSISPIGRLAHFSMNAIEPLSARRWQRPPSTSPVREVAEREPYAIVAAVEAQNRELTEMLEAAPIAEPEVAAA